MTRKWVTFSNWTSSTRFSPVAVFLVGAGYMPKSSDCEIAEFLFGFHYCLQHGEIWSIVYH